MGSVLNKYPEKKLPCRGDVPEGFQLRNPNIVLCGPIIEKRTSLFFGIGKSNKLE
jgi:hypothetical protein